MTIRLLSITFIYFAWIIVFKPSLFFMVFNIFLTIIPFAAAICLLRVKAQGTDSIVKKLLAAGFAVIWFLFYPNSPYILTDFIHIKSERFFIANPLYELYSSEPRILFNTDFELWYNFLLIGVGVIIGLLLGFISLYKLHRTIRQSTNAYVGWGFVLIMQFLSGFAIYLGRFIRWNSWDLITHPSNLWIIITRDINLESMQFTLLFAIASTVIYIMLYSLIKENKSRDFFS